MELVFRRPAKAPSRNKGRSIDTELAKGVKAISISVISPENQTDYLNSIAKQGATPGRGQRRRGQATAVVTWARTTSRAARRLASSSKKPCQRAESSRYSSAKSNRSMPASESKESLRNSA